MDHESGTLMRRLYWLLVLLLVLQATAIGLVLRFGAARLASRQTLLARTETMMEEILPGLKKDVAEVSQKATDIKGGISDLRTQVSKVDNHVGEVGRHVTAVGRTVERMDTSLTGFLGDTSGLIWGHSLNPYVLIAVLLGLAGLVPLCGWLFAHKSRSRNPSQDKQSVTSMLSVAGRLDKLSDLLEKIGTSSGASEPRNPELKRLMVETERLIQEARTELGQLSPSLEPEAKQPEKAPDEFH